MPSTQKRVWFRHCNAWHSGTVDRVSGAYTTVIASNGTKYKKASKAVYPQKHNGRKYKTTSEVLPRKRAGTTRPLPFRVPIITIEPVAFRAPGEHGDYRWQAQQTVDAAKGVDEALLIYNENENQQRDKTNNWAGGGNAGVRPYRSQGIAIGMPTGRHGGFSSLDEFAGIDRAGREQTAKEFIDEATREIVEHVVTMHPGRFSKIHYSVNAPDANDDKPLIGMGIFNIDHAVREHITASIWDLPKQIAREAYKIRCAAA